LTFALGNFEVTCSTRRSTARVDPHHTLNIPWQEKDRALSSLQDIGANIEKSAAAAQRKLLDQCLRSDGQPLELSFVKGTNTRSVVSIVPIVPSFQPIKNRRAFDHLELLERLEPFGTIAMFSCIFQHFPCDHMRHHFGAPSVIIRLR